MSMPIALTIAGSDSGGGAGIQADLKTFAAFGVYGTSAITALTAQNTLGVSGIHNTPPSFIAAQIDAVFSDFDVRAVKIGMVSQADAIRAIAASLQRWQPQNVVLDPVMVATSGDRLLAGDAVALLRAALFPLATVVTPNLPEAAVLLDAPEARGMAAIAEQGRALLASGCPAVLIKGGHGDGNQSVDYLVTAHDVHPFASARIATTNTHGSGCTLSAAIAAGLAKGETLVVAIEAAKRYVSAAIEAGGKLTLGKGHGPLHHFYFL